jgi:hypothetical protein
MLKRIICLFRGHVPVRVTWTKKTHHYRQGGRFQGRHVKWRRTEVRCERCDKLLY